MRSHRFSYIRLSLSLLLLLTFGTSNGLKGQIVPVQFDRYYGFSETSDYLHKVAASFPEITELIEIGVSGMGRSVEVLIITNRNKGFVLDRYVNLQNKRKEGVKNVLPMENHQTKPAQWICGATHGNEVASAAACLYIIDKLISAYNQDEVITDMIDNQTFYICPIVNPDGYFNSVDKGIPQRGNSLLRDDDGDGKINEDGPEDMNGDGLISRFRYEDPKGLYVKHAEHPEVMVRLPLSVKTDLQRFSVVMEGIDNDGDGKVNEDGEEGFDLNRNFPEGWFTDEGEKGGTGDYPTSAPETRAIAEFFTTHQNIHQAQFFHTSGGFTYRPMGASSDDSMHPEDIAVYDYVLGKKYVELLGTDLPPAWVYPDSVSEYRKALSESSVNRYAIKRGYEMPDGWVVSWNEKSDKPYSYGLQADWAYMQLGIYSLTTELYTWKRDIPGGMIYADSSWSMAQKALINYQRDHFDGKFFVDWKPYKHEQLGHGEVGGWVSFYGSNNPLPGAMLEEICETHWQFEKYRAGLMPRVQIVSAEAKVVNQTGRERIVEVTARIENQGQLSSHINVGERLPLNRQDVVWLIGEQDKIEFLQGRPWQQLGFLGGKLSVPHTRQKRSSAEAKWLIRMNGQSELTIVSSSQRGGTHAMEVKIK